MPKVISCIFFLPVLALKSTANFMSFLYKPWASRQQFLDLTFLFYCRTNFQEFGMILKCKNAEYDRALKSFLLISRTIISLLIMPCVNQCDVDKCVCNI